jgi:hypothetical protein
LEGTGGPFVNLFGMPSLWPPRFHPDVLSGPVPYE